MFGTTAEGCVQISEFFLRLIHNGCSVMWCRGVVVITTAQLHSTKSELRFCAGSDPAPGVSEICDCEYLWQWSRLEIRLNAFSGSTIPQKQFIIIIITSSSSSSRLFRQIFRISSNFSCFTSCLVDTLYKEH